jgi:hypothetical protein
MEERRAEVRRPAYGDARIRLDFGKSIACALLDRSDFGARLKVVSVLGIPDNFILQIGEERLPATVAWKKPGEIGVSLFG